MGIDPSTHKPRTDMNQLLNLSHIISAAPFGNLMNPWDNIAQLAKIQFLQNLLQILNASSSSLVPNMDSTTITLLGSQSLNPLFQGQINNTQVVSPQDASLSPGSIPEATDQDLWVLADSWKCSGDLDAFSNSFNGSCYPEKTLPQLVSVSNEMNTISQMESKGNTTHHPSTSSSPASSTFEDWKKLLDDESSDSYWENILK